MVQTDGEWENNLMVLEENMPSWDELKAVAKKDYMKQKAEAQEKLDKIDKILDKISAL